MNDQQIDQWHNEINNARCEHQHKLRLQLQKLKKNNKTEVDWPAIEHFKNKLSASISAVKKIRDVKLDLSLPTQLPISQRQKEIARLIENNQVVIIAGETGSGKTTQLPKICLSLGLGNKGLIGHTQPRRIAARTVADRIASELKKPLGDTVGYQVRFNNVSSDNTRIKLMTDGVLLAEFQRDRFLSRYEVIIIDEAHERSLNIDFLLGLLKPLCEKRPDLKIIITSATIDLERFSKHFSIKNKPAPIIEVSGRTYPVETFYQPIQKDNTDLADVICDTVQQIVRNEAKGVYKANGDILVFCAGEREIRDAALALNRSSLNLEVLPLYSRLSISEQNKVFKPANKRKVVLATNVAETSITVPGIAYVIDPGLARISRYSFRSKIQRLPIEAVSQASANQRMGRCGRVANGVCIRLYSQEDFNARAKFTPAEILRSNLASVILKMLRLGVKNISQFAFIDQPDKRLFNDGYKLLQELNAIDQDRKLTDIGKQMSDLPVDPRYARILVSAEELGCLHDALILISALSIQDPRERPADKQQAADQAHRELAHQQSDFFSYLYLWQAINNQREALSNTKFKQFCLERFWSIARVFEWRELYHQLHGLCKDLKWKVEPWKNIQLAELSSNKNNKTKQNKRAKKTTSNHFDKRYEVIHRALLSGLLSNIATKDIDDAYTATRGRNIHLFPGSPQAKIKPKWLITAELIETSRLFAHTIAQIKPEWVIDSAAHLCKYNYGSPRYESRTGSIKAQRKTLLYGLVLRDKERVNYGAINPTESRVLFIQQGLVEANYKPTKKHNFFDHNQRLIGDIEKIETKTRKRNLLINEQELYAFYNERIPAQINNRNSLERWLTKQSNDKTNTNNDLLKLNREQLLVNQVEPDDVAQFPDKIDVHGKSVSINYKFNPGQAQDGVTMVVPISVLAPFPEHIGDWLVPGLLREKCIALIKTLPKQIRRNFAPAADAVDRVFDNLTLSNSPLHKELATLLFKTRGVKVEYQQFDLSKLDQYYLMNYRVIDVDGSLIDEDHDLSGLKQRYADSVQESVHVNHSPERNKFEQQNITQWDFGDLSEHIEYLHQGMTVRVYPCLSVEEDDSISLTVSDQQNSAQYQSSVGILQLAKKELSAGSQRQAAKYLLKELMSVKKKNNSNNQNAKLNGLSNLATQLKQVAVKPGNRNKWVNEIMLAGLNQSCFTGIGININDVRDKESFEKALNTGSKNWVSNCIEIEQSLSNALDHRDKILAQLDAISAETIEVDRAIEDMKAQLYRLFEPRILRYTPFKQLNQYIRYMRAIESRIEKLKFASKTVNEEIALQEIQTLFEKKLDDFDNSQLSSSPDYVYHCYPDLHDFSILLEEWRVSIFAQHLKTMQPVSEKRLRSAWQKIENDYER